MYRISGGTTWHAAGLLTQLRGTENETKLIMYALELIPELEQETDTKTGKTEELEVIK